jgi:hypothetical protein
MNFITFQQAITTTGTAQQLAAHPVVNSITIHALSTNAASVVIGTGSTVTATTGFVLEKGNSVTVSIANTNQLWAVGTAADSISVIGS